MCQPAALLGLLLACSSSVAAETSQWVDLPGGAFRSVLELADSPLGTGIAPFSMTLTPVTNRQFLGFVLAEPRWQRDRAPTTLAEARYLSHWVSATELGNNALPDWPVIWVSWHAANSYCRWQGGRLPSWNEWEYAAAADSTRFDARDDPAWRERILAWYARPSATALPSVGLGTPNAYGVKDLHGLVWEWVDDYSALLVSSDNREQGAADQLKFCGAGALSTSDRDNYAVLMRIAMLSSLEAEYVTGNLGFRCVRSP